jgi:hypothetical protein
VSWLSNAFKEVGKALPQIGLGAAAFATGGLSAGGLPLILGGTKVIDNARQQAWAKDVVRQNQQAQSAADQIRKGYEADTAIQQNLLTPDLTDEIIRKARSTEVLRQRAAQGRASSFLTGVGGTLANASLLTDGSGGRRMYG